MTWRKFWKYYSSFKSIIVNISLRGALNKEIPKMHLILGTIMKVSLIKNFNRLQLGPCSISGFPRVDEQMIQWSKYWRIYIICIDEQVLTNIYNMYWRICIDEYWRVCTDEYVLTKQVLTNMYNTLILLNPF